MNKDIDTGVVIVTTRNELKSIINECIVEAPTTTTENPIPESPKFLYSISELASFLGCSIGTAQKLKNSGKIRYKQFGRKCVFTTQEILEDINKSKSR